MFCEGVSWSPQNLDVTVVLYNQVRETILDVEYPLVESQLARIDQQLVKAVSQLNWTSDGEAIVHAHAHACRVWERRAVGRKRKKMSKCWGEGKLEEGVGEGR